MTCEVLISLESTGELLLGENRLVYAIPTEIGLLKVLGKFVASPISAERWSPQVSFIASLNIQFNYLFETIIWVARSPRKLVAWRTCVRHRAATLLPSLLHVYFSHCDLNFDSCRYFAAWFQRVDRNDTVSGYYVDKSRYVFVILTPIFQYCALLIGLIAFPCMA